MWGLLSGFECPVCSLCPRAYKTKQTFVNMRTVTRGRPHPTFIDVEKNDLPPQNRAQREQPHGAETLGSFFPTKTDNLAGCLSAILPPTAQMGAPWPKVTSR